MPFWAYILQCADGKYYTGHSDNLEARFAQHQTGGYCDYTSRRRPVRLVWSENFATRIEALEAERRIKPWSRAKKQALIAGDWSALSHFARPPHERPSTSLGTNGVFLPPPSPFVSSETCPERVEAIETSSDSEAPSCNSQSAVVSSETCPERDEAIETCPSTSLGTNGVIAPPPSPFARLPLERPSTSLGTNGVVAPPPSPFAKPPHERPSTSLGTNGVPGISETPFVSSEACPERAEAIETRSPDEIKAP